MPARIDATERRARIVEAAFRCVVAEGFEGASLRKVAVESGLNIGSVRHYFDGHNDLLVAAAAEAGSRMDARLRPYSPSSFAGLSDQDTQRALRNLLEEVLPMDATRRDETIVVVEFVFASRLHSALASFSREMHASLHTVLARAFESAGIPGAELAAQHTAAVIGGLTTDAITPHGELSPAAIRQVLDHHLALLVETRTRR